MRAENANRSPAGSPSEIRKAALWSCSSGLDPIDPKNGVGFAEACGIRPTRVQMKNYVMKNTAWVVDGLLPNLLQGPDSVDSSAHVATQAELLWVSGPNRVSRRLRPDVCLGLGV